VERQPLISSAKAAALAGLFKVMANDTRLRLLHALAREGELGVTALARAVGMKPQAVSNQLQRLADRGILDSRRNGNGILYRIVDPCVVVLLDRGWCLLADSRRRPRG
jgi:DNA-binding transcriptional ArsR family regulator